MFDSAELNAVYNAARRGVSKYKGAHATALLAVAAHVRAMTLREAAKMTREKEIETDYVWTGDDSICVDDAATTLRNLAESFERLADATGKDGAA